MSLSNFAGCTLVPKLIQLLALIIGSLLLPATGIAQGPENTVVVINADSSDSLAVANHYIHLRDIPASNVVYVSGITHMKGLGTDTFSSANFLKQIVRPVMTAIQDRGLDRQISCITYSAGLPTRINARPQVDKYREQRGLKENKIWFGPWASATSLTFLYDDVFSSAPDYFLETNGANHYESRPDRNNSTRNFSAGAYWSRDGSPNGTADQGRRYFLSTMLAIVGERRSSLESALAQMDRSCHADGTHPQATVYFAKHKDVRSRTRTPQFDAAAAELRSLGHEAIIGSAPMVANQKAVIGATLGSSEIDLKAAGSQFSPGAICDNLTSYGGCWWPKFQTKLTTYLDAGAAGASGTVCEPYAISNKFPSARLHAHYARGCTLAESFYQSIKWPLQLLIVGDPLCCPYGKFPQFEIKGIQNGATITSDFVLSVAPTPSSPAIAHYELFYDDVFLSKISDSNQIKVETKAITDGYHELRIVGVSDAPIANRHTEKVSFLVDRDGYSVDLNIRSPEISLGRALQGRAVSSFGNDVEIWQNGRSISNIQSNQSFIIRTGKLGLGKTNLQAVATLPSGRTIKSRPVPVSIVSHGVIQKREKLPAPNKSELKKAIASIRKLLKDHYQDTSPEGRDKLLKLLRKTADESESDPVNHFALLSECVYAASVFGEVDAGWSACDQIDADYETEQLSHLDFIKQIKTKLDEKTVRSLYSKGIGLAERLIATDRFKDAGDLAKSLGAAVNKPLPTAKPEIDSLVERTKILARKYKQIQLDLGILTKNPSDKSANENVGKFYCLLKNDFEQGLPYLAKGSDSPLQKLASDQLALKTKAPAQRLEIADRWWNLAQDKKLSGLELLALEHYRDIEDDLKGLAKVKVEQRIKEANSKGPKSKTTAVQLANHDWKILWNHGWIWENIELKKDHLAFTSRPVKSTNSLPHRFEYREIGNGIEVWTKDKVVYYQIHFLNNELVCSKLDTKTKDTVEGIGVRVGTEKSK